VSATLESNAYLADLLHALDAATSCVSLGFYTELISTAEAAEKVGVSPSVFLRLARDVVGVLPSAREREELASGVVVVRLLWKQSDVERVRGSSEAAASRARRRRTMP
jgi:hypothetical protein